MTPSLKMYRVSTGDFREGCVRCVLLFEAGGRTLYIRSVVSGMQFKVLTSIIPLGDSLGRGTVLCDQLTYVNSARMILKRK